MTLEQHVMYPSDKPPEQPMQIAPCPCCGGPPVLNSKHEPVTVSAEAYLSAEAHVWCHECGTKGPCADALMFEIAELWGVQTRAVELWNARDNRHLYLYNAGTPDGHHVYPRADGRDVPR